MAPVIRPANTSSMDFTDSNQLHFKTEDEMNSSFALDNMSGGEEDEDEEDGDDSLALKRATKKTGDQPVSKRTLQNRKAQREFRKRREARVRELEERCRRFDQMGLEANSELQRAARGLKEENDALRGFVMRMGLGHMLQDILSEVNNNHRSINGNDQITQNSSHQQATFSGGMFDNGGQSTNSFGNQPTFFIDPSTAAANTNYNRGRSMTTGNDYRPTMNNQIDAEKMANGIPMPSPLQYGQMTLAPTPTPLKSSNQENKMQRPSSSKAGSSSSPSSSRSTDNNAQEAPLLSLNLAQKQAQQDSRQTQPEFAQPQSKEWNSSNNSQQGLGSIFGGSNNHGMGSGGTSMLQNINGGANFAPFPVVPQRNRQNAALLNPNPIPFAFNLSAGDLANQQPTWWEQMGGGSEQIELDDKAQAVANAQAGSGGQGAPSPFDLSAFLQGGITPGGGFQLAPVGSSQGGLQSDPLAAAVSSEMVKQGSTDTDHMRMFIQLMERKMAERDAHTYASLGFQPPSQDPAQRNKQEQQQQQQMESNKANSNFGGIHMTPSGVYSRLAQHPAFLSTNAREMEELVDALGPSTWKKDNQEKGGEDEKQQKDDKNTKKRIRSPQSDSQSKSPSTKLNSSPDDKSKKSKIATPDHDGSPGKVHVDEIAIGKLLGLLDQKRNSNFKGFTNGGIGNNYDDNQTFSVAMT